MLDIRVADNVAMHLMIPFAFAASPDPALGRALRDLRLPNLIQLLERLELRQTLEGDEYSFSLPHERAMAHLWGWTGGDGALPFAAIAAKADGIDIDEEALGLITPVHLHLGRDQVTLTDPQRLQLSEIESAAIFESVRGLFESEGFTLYWGAPTRWYLQHDSLAGLPTASLDRVIGRNIDLWLKVPDGSSPEVRKTIGRIHRLQSEFQMLLYSHDITRLREGRGELAVNSFWLSGCGRYQAAGPEALQIEERLHVPILMNDYDGWAQAWRTIDDDRVFKLLQLMRKGQPVSLTLCGERHARLYATPGHRPSWLERIPQISQLWARFEASAVLESL